MSRPALKATRGLTAKGPCTVLFALTLVVAAVGCDGDDGGGGGQAGGGDGERGPASTPSELVTEAEFPLALSFAPDGRLFFNERFTGNIRVIDAEGQLLPEPFATVENLSAEGAEWGLIGLALDPQFEDNGYVYAYYTEHVQDGPPKIAHPLIVRYTDQDGTGVDRIVLVDDLPETDPEHDAGSHIGGNLRFGPSGYLYASVGDMEASEDAADPSNLRGTIVRVDPADGSAPSDNPLADDARADPHVFAYGFRNPFAFAFQPETDRLYAADNGPFKCDRLVMVVGGTDYQWPDLDSICEGEGVTAPAYFFHEPGVEGTDDNSNPGPSGLAFVTGDRYPSLAGTLLSCEWDTGSMRRLELSDDGTSVTGEDIVTEDCRLDVAVSPDGTVYYTNDSEIRRLVAD